MDSKNNFPRQLIEREKEWLFFLLPSGRPGYHLYRDKIDSMCVIGEGRFGEGNYVLGYEGDEPDLSYSSLPMFATGQVIFKECTIQVSIHELYDNKIEISINNVYGEGIPDELTEISRWTYSNWLPGTISPFPDDKLRETDILTGSRKAVLAISQNRRTIWLYESNSGMNYIIPVTNFLNELMRGNTKIDRTKGININYIFENLDLFSDDDFVKAFVQYNKQYRKIDLPDAEIAKPKKSGFIKKIFG
ncbi:MAG: hypothetical protein ACHQJ4_05390 [Ignavibacteria bacterium]